MNSRHESQVIGAIVKCMDPALIGVFFDAAIDR